jgi:hypothetical protein
MSHPHMALKIEECVELTHLKEKVTVVIPTRNSSMECLLWSVFSLLLRSEPHGMMEHFCVCINGPDERTGDTKMQDQKQKFLEELRDLEWYHAANPKLRKQMPLTVIRAWSRVGYAEVFEMALNWVHTDAYCLMHDDVILLNKNWDKEVKEKFYNKEDVALAYVPPLHGCICDHAIHRGMYLIRLPQLQTTFVVCKKKDIMKVGALWRGYHIPSDENMLQFDLEEIGNVAEFEKFWKDQGLYNKPVIKTELYNFVRQEIGAWVYYKLYQAGYKLAELPLDTILHLGGMSRIDTTPEIRMEKIKANNKEIKMLEKEILDHPEYSVIYKKYLPADLQEN